MINKDFYREFVSEFCKKLQEIPEKCHPESGIFIPYTFDKYNETEKKIFFVGIDTAGWIKTTEMLIWFLFSYMYHPKWQATENRGLR